MKSAVVPIAEFGNNDHYGSYYCIRIRIRIRIHLILASVFILILLFISLISFVYCLGFCQALDGRPLECRVSCRVTCDPQLVPAGSACALRSPTPLASHHSDHKLPWRATAVPDVSCVIVVVVVV